jgi:LysM repeat protein
MQNSAAEKISKPQNAAKNLPLNSQKESRLLENNPFGNTQAENPFLAIQQKPDANLIQKVDINTGMTTSRNVTDAKYGWTSSYEVEIDDNFCTISIKAKVNPDAGVLTTQVRNIQRVTANEFARYFDRRFNLVDADGIRRPIRVRLQYVDSGEHLTIALHAGTGRDDLSNWFVGGDNITRAHELGHQLGFKDEYVDPDVPHRATGTSPGVSHDHSLMGNYYSQGIRGADVRGRHGDELASDISNATGTAFTAEFSDTYIVRSGDNLSWIAQRIYGDERKARDIYALNRAIIRNPDLIYPGQELRLPPR